LLRQIKKDDEWNCKYINLSLWREGFQSFGDQRFIYEVKAVSNAIDQQKAYSFSKG
jgi:hypothetical protein